MTVANTLRWSEEQLAAHQRRTLPPATPAAARPVALGKLRDSGMNQTESEYAALLNVRAERGEVAWWKYEAITLKLADNTRYTPDFVVMLAGGEIEIHETKGGFIREDGWLKLKLAASLFPFRFLLCQKAARKDGGSWSIRRV
jgi:hypothetical protein